MLPYANRIIYHVPLLDADYYVVTSVHAAAWVVSRMPVFTQAIFVVSGPSCAKVIKQYCPSADVRQNPQPGVIGILDELASLPGRGIWCRGQTVMAPDAFQCFNIQSVVVYDVQPWQAHPELRLILNAGLVECVCIESMGQAVALHQWLKYNPHVQLWAKSERIRHYLSEEGWKMVENKSHAIGQIRKEIIC